MKVLFEKTFLLDLEKIRNKRLLKQVKDVVAQAKSTESAGDIKDLKMMRDYKTCYRINLGDYRIGIQILRQKFVFARLVHRKEMYRYFP